MNAIDAVVGVRGARGARDAAAGPARPTSSPTALIAGVGSVIVFLPQIVLLFTLLYLLEDVGYMARAAFVIDRVMGRIGLEGRSFVSLLSSYACAVPGIMATRTIPSPRNRLVTILVAPLMTCSARLPVYALLIGAFVPATAVFGPLRPAGPGAARPLSARRARGARAWRRCSERTLMRGESLPFYMELPPYRMPTARLVATQVWGSARRVPAPRRHDHPHGVDRALGAAHFPRTPAPAGATPAEARRFALEHSLAGRTGHALEPLIAPLGFDWKIGVGLLASLAAREVIVATLAQIYAASDEEHLAARRAAPRRRSRAPGARSSRPRRWPRCSSSSCSRCSACRRSR